MVDVNEFETIYLYYIILYLKCLCEAGWFLVPPVPGTIRKTHLHCWFRVVRCEQPTRTFSNHHSFADSVRCLGGCAFGYGGCASVAAAVNVCDCECERCLLTHAITSG